MRTAAALGMLVVLALLCACEDEMKPDVTITERDFNGVVVAKVGHVIDLALKANPTTGYQWRCSWEPRNLLRLLGDRYVADDNPDGRVGAGGVHHFVLRATRDGVAVITVQYGQQWAGGEREKPRRIVVRIVE